MAKIAKHIEDPITLKVRTQVNQGIMQALEAKGFTVYFDYSIDINNNANLTICYLDKYSKDGNRHILIEGKSSWNEEKDVQNWKYARAVAFERAYETYQKYIKCT